MRFGVCVCVGFMSPTQYLKMKKSKKVELLPITPVFVHPRNTALKPGYFADIIMHTDAELANPLYHHIPTHRK